MALYVNNVLINDIIVDGKKVNAVRVNSSSVSKGVWGRPFTISYSLSSGVLSIRIKRTKSEYQNAITGSLGNGSTIYYGDLIEIEAVPLNGYTIKNIVVNNSYHSANPVSVGCTGDMVISVVAEVEETPAESWHTVWTGSRSYYQLMATEKTKTETFTGVTRDRPTRVSGTGYNKKTTTFTGVELPAGVKTQVVNDNGTPQYITYDGMVTFTFAVKGSFANKGIVLTKIEQYY